MVLTHGEIHSMYDVTLQCLIMVIFLEIQGQQTLKTLINALFTFLSCSSRAFSLTFCRAVLTAFSRAFWCSSFCCSSAASMWIRSPTLCSASCRFNWSMRRCAWAIRAFRSSSDSLPAHRKTHCYFANTVRYTNIYTMSFLSFCLYISQN